jgi:peptidoglycan/LPS O-acetylase OafA/YrhL
MTKHVPHFEVLRGAAALWVVASHILLIVGRHVPFVSAGDQAVEVFVILSGFVIALMRYNEKEEYGQYIFRRFLRLYPVFILAVSIGSITEYLYAPVFGNSPWTVTHEGAFIAREQNTLTYLWQNILLHAGMLHGVVPDTIIPQAPLAFSGPLWSISLEWQFYLIAPALIAFIRFDGIRAIALTICVSALALALQKLTQRYWIGEVTSFLPLRLPLFIVGIASALLWHRAREAPQLTLAGAVAAGALIALPLAPHKLPVLIWAGTYYLAATHGRLAVLRTVDALLVSAAPRLIGKISYSVYALHVPILLVVSYFIVFPLAADSSRWFGGALLVGIALPIVILVAILSYHFIEKPTIAWGRRAFATRRVSLRCGGSTH